MIQRASEELSRVEGRGSESTLTRRIKQWRRRGSLAGRAGFAIRLPQAAEFSSIALPPCPHPGSLTGKNCHVAETSLYETPHLCCRGHLLRMHDHTHLAPKTVPKARLHQHKTGQQPPGRTLPSLSLRTTGHLTPCSQPNPLIVHTGFVDPFCRRSSKSWGDQATKY